MTATSLRSRYSAWQLDAPWAEWSRRRRALSVLFLGLPVLLGCIAFLGAFAVSWCGILGGDCTPAEERQIRIFSAIVWGSYLVTLAGAVAMFLLRRKVFWLVCAVLGFAGILDVML